MIAPATEVVHATRFPLLVLERHEVELDAGRLAEARHELLAGCKPGNSRFRSGFLLGVQAGGKHPVCLQVASELRRRLLGPLAETFALSFYKLAEGEPPDAEEGPFYEGPHLDTHPELNDATELMRLLVNLSPYPRRFVYWATDRWLLAERGVAYGRREFVPLAVPEEIETRIVEIPGRSQGSIHALKFLASAVPHVGLNDQPEHFLVSFEAVAGAAEPAPLAGASAS